MKGVDGHHGRPFNPRSPREGHHPTIHNNAFQFHQYRLCVGINFKSPVSPPIGLESSSLGDEDMGSKSIVDARDWTTSRVEG